MARSYNVPLYNATTLSDLESAYAQAKAGVKLKPQQTSNKKLKDITRVYNKQKTILSAKAAIVGTPQNPVGSPVGANVPSGSNALGSRLVQSSTLQPESGPNLFLWAGVGALIWYFLKK